MPTFRRSPVASRMFALCFTPQEPFENAREKTFCLQFVPKIVTGLLTYREQSVAFTLVISG